MRKKSNNLGMISEERRLKILEILDEKRTVTVKELSAIFGVSEDTIRQDLKVLEEQRLLRRIYGGAT
ncbi:MAG: DeoR/GlpR transcriptional regulator, partial [Candidatus Atribacteria bacterium]|nr:DeoR/GlpR transcriptional regulator [Candidatus Atribacteria bacterium]